VAGSRLITPFPIPFSQTAVDGLRDRLARTRWPDEIAGSGWKYGFNLKSLQSICE
jgi:epoxide hydrolase